MKKILIVDDQDWVINFYSDVLISKDLRILTTDDINTADESIKSFQPDLVLINLDLKDESNTNDVYRNIKMKHPRLSVLIVSPYDMYLFSTSRFQANPYFVKGCVSPEELGQKIENVLNKKSAVQEETRLSFLQNGDTHGTVPQPR